MTANILATILALKALITDILYLPLLHPSVYCLNFIVCQCGCIAIDDIG